ncbi:tyrosine-type recombinase/integrase [Clostridium felsineum]|uniref:Tyrosine recombinase XerD n=1 Tax=Clostridium felsineum TaxID=36839 RepID=A0A1S8L5I1_9CLOT|nr:tyrosine-type recombinase/integrase [Clostridium felsineum]URZ06622.1 Tyrosine recombinase XerD [Clostridium felsineum]URZ11655.1 Tyrosine recombinase XerD [Clostridium felsineum]
MENLNVLEQFTDYLIENDKNTNTIESYLSDIKQFFLFYKKDIKDLNKLDIKKYTQKLKNEGLKISTMQRKLVALNQLIIFSNEMLNLNIAVKIKQLKTEKQYFINDMMEINDLKRIIKAAIKKNDVRAVTVFYTLFYTGARVSEMLQIKVKDIDKNSITILGKGNKYRELLIPKKLQVQWQKYLECRENSSEFLFTGQRGSITRQTIHNDIKKYTGLARGIDKSIAHAHAFRHLYAKSLTDLGINPITIAQLLGHSLTVTGLYISQSKKELLKTINKLDIDKM